MLMKKYFKWAGIVVLVPVLLVLILFLLFYFPPFQNWAVKQVASYASEKTQLDIRVEHVNLEFPLNLGIDGIHVIQQNDSLPQVKDTVADIRKTVVDIQLLPLLDKQVMIDQILFADMKMNTTNFIPQARVKGRVGHLDLRSHGIDLGKSLAHVDNILLKDARLNVELSDTVPEDTSKSENFWKVDVEKLKVANTAVSVHMPGDTLQVDVYMSTMNVREGHFDLYKSLYRVAHLDWKGTCSYDNHFAAYSKGLDFNHLSLADLSLAVDSFYYCSPDMSVILRHCQFKEKSGLSITNLAGPMRMDSSRLYLPEFYASTPGSRLKVSLKMDLDAFSDSLPGVFETTVDGSFAKADIVPYMDALPHRFSALWPSYPLTVKGTVKGNLQKMRFTGLQVELPTAFRLSGDGFISNATDVNRLKADVNFNAHTYNLGFITKSFLDADLLKTIRVPSGIALAGNVKVKGNRYNTRFRIAHGGGSLSGNANIVNGRTLQYTARLNSNRMPLQNFVPRMGLSRFTGSVSVNGSGTDFMHPSTRLLAKAHIRSFNYAGYSLAGMKLDASLRNGVAHATVDSNNPMLKGLISIDGLLRRKVVKASVSCDLSHADLFGLKFTETPFTMGLCANVDVETDMNKYYKVQGLISDITVRDNNQTYRPEDLVLDLLTNRDTTHCVADCGDFHLVFNAHGMYDRMLSQVEKLTLELQSQIKNRTINQIRIRERLPQARIYLTSGSDNFFVHMLGSYGYQFARANIDMTSSPVTGLNGSVAIDSLIADSIQLDTIRFNIVTIDDNFHYTAQVRNGKKNPQYTFNALFDGQLNDRGSSLKASLYDDKNRLGVDLGLQAIMEHNGLRLSIMDEDPILGYKIFHVNDSNYIFLGDDRRVSANMKLQADDGMGVQIFTDDDNLEALQDVTVSLYKFNLQQILSVVPYMPHVSGILDGDYHFIQTQDEMSISSNMSIKNLVYEHCPMGNVSTEFVYMPKADGSHYVDGVLMCDDNEVASIKGTYQSQGEGYLDATLALAHTPMSLVNGFIPNQIFGFRGYGEGSVAVKGSLSKPDVNGEVYLDSCYLVSQPYGVEMRFDNDPITITNSRLLFENFQMYANNDSPLTISGYLDFANLDRMMMDVRMRAENFQIIDAKENLRSEAYGKAFVNLYGMMSGPVDNLQMRGRLDVLGSTDLTYILRDSPLTTDNQLDELVKFTDFADTAQLTVNRPPLTGFSMDMTLNINESAHILCALNADKSNYVDLIGGGELRMKYNNVDNLRLTGRYTLNNGEMKYSLPVIPLKTFTIQDGSYIEFTGDPMNPRLNITATEHNKATVSSDGGAERSVDFTCGVVISKTLNNMGLEFIIDAPQDMSVSNQLNTMSKEERGKIAVTMLTTGMYLTDGNTSRFTMNSALNAFLQSQINGIAGNALRTLDLSFGLDNTTDATGTQHTDYSFKFAKRFWNNRLRVIVGGKISSGTNAAGQNQQFFNNISLEYRLNEASTQYLKLFYDRDSYDWLEGNVGEYGAGFIWRRKISSFRDILKFNDSNKLLLPSDSLVKTRTDSIKNKK